MAAFSSVKRRVAAVVVMALGTLGAAGLTPGWSGPRQGAAPTPLQLFQKMLPVIRHDRCMNCHGGVDPVSGRDHEGGMIHPDTACAKCHKTEPTWHLPTNTDHFFYKKTDQELCALFADFAMHMGHADFISRHIESDEFIIAAFQGWMGGARDSNDGESPDPPPIDQEAFIKLAEDWLTHGQGACEALGTIYLEESVESSDTIPTGPGVETIVRQSGKRTVTITLSGGQYHADINTNGQIVTTQVQHTRNAQGRPCTFTLIGTTKYSGSTTGLAVVSVTDTIFQRGPRPPSTDYRIDVSLPPESGRRVNTTVIDDGCGSRMEAPPPTTETLAWDEVHFTLEGHVKDPASEGRTGACDKRIKHVDVGSKKWEDDVNHCNRFASVGNADTPGLMDHDDAHVAYHDGRDIEFRVVSRWNLKFK